jgi:hypothetical protein
MGGDWYVVRGLGLLILTVLVIGGLGLVSVVLWEYPQLELSFFFIPWLAMAALGMILLWVVTALATLIRTRRGQTD